MLAYGSLHTFFGGLEAVVGSPDPKVREAMGQEHTNRPDSCRKFTTGNYELTTDSSTEWAFVVTPLSPPGGGFPSELTISKALHAASSEGTMPPELASLLATGVEPRAPMQLDAMQAKLEVPNAKLKDLGEPEASLDEAIAARLYTVREPCACSGPCHL